MVSVVLFHELRRASRRNHPARGLQVAAQGLEVAVLKLVLHPGGRRSWSWLHNWGGWSGRNLRRGLDGI
jgi:hypothetical protein